jgi:hypothetical protein
MDLLLNGIIILIGLLILGILATAFGADSRDSFDDDWVRTGRR